MSWYEILGPLCGSGLIWKAIKWWQRKKWWKVDWEKGTPNPGTVYIQNNKVHFNVRFRLGNTSDKTKTIEKCKVVLPDYPNLTWESDKKIRIDSENWEEIEFHPPFFVDINSFPPGFPPESRKIDYIYKITVFNEKPIEVVKGKFDLKNL